MNLPGVSYLTLKFAHALFQCAPEALDGTQRTRVDAAVVRQREIEAAILASPQAAQVVLPPAHVEHCFAQIVGRYDSEADFLAALAGNGLTPAALLDEIERDQKVEAILEKIAANVRPVSRQEAEIFYYLHLERFRRPEQRHLRHILISINPDIGGSDRISARARIEAIAKECPVAPEQFAELALRHSECPTALQGGKLGKLSRGQLFPEIDAVAFEMAAGTVSSIVESPIGFHLLFCDAVDAAGVAPFSLVAEKITTLMYEARRNARQRAWIRTLLTRTHAVPLRRRA